MTDFRERDEKMVEILEETMKLYRTALTIGEETQERIILQYIQGVSAKHEELLPVHQVCTDVLNAYPERMPHDNTLIEEAKDRLDKTYARIFPQTRFDEDMLVFQMFDVLIQEQYNSIPFDEFDRFQRFFIENVFSGLHKTLIDNKNFKGDRPYYKSHYHSMTASKKTWLELLDKDFKNCLRYFKEEDEG